MTTTDEVIDRSNRALQERDAIDGKIVEARRLLDDPAGRRRPRELTER